MGKKQNKNEGEKKKGDGGKKEEDKSLITAVLKVDMHCEGCSSKIVRFVKGFEGVETVKSEWAANKITVTGKMDTSKLKEKLEQKTKKNVEIISPQPTKDKDKKEKSDKKADDKKPKEAPVTTAVLKLSLHCEGCMEKIHKIISKYKGVVEFSMDEPKNLVTVKGTMDAKALSESLSEKMRRPVEIVPPKKEKDGGESNSSGADGDKNKKKDGGGGGGGGGEGGKAEENKMQHAGQVGYGYYGYGPSEFVEHPHPPPPPPQMFSDELLHPPQMFSDENPNACHIM